MVAIGDIIEAVVLSVNGAKRELALGMKQMESNPWSQIETKYPSGTRIQGRVRNLTAYGAFIEIEEGIDGLLHLSDMSWSKTILKPSELIKKGDKLEVVVLAVDSEKKRVSLGLKQLTDDPWPILIPQKYSVGSVVSAKIIKATKLGAVVELEPYIEGILKISKQEGTAESNTQPKQEETVKVEVTEVEPSEGRISVKLAETGGESAKASS
jgi:small subunit ribosomal protein S1